MINNKTYTPKESEINRKWYIIDATDLTLGKLATEAANILRGKNKPEFTPNMDMGDNLIIINAKDIKFSGNKLQNKMYRRHTGYLGGLKELTAEQMMEKYPERAIMLAVKGMIPHTKLGRAQIKKLRVYKDENHNHEAQKPEVWEVK